MGKATGGSHISSGQYNITREMDESVFEAILEKVKLRRDALNDVLIPEKQAEYDSLESESANRNLDLSNAIVSLRLVMQGVKEPYSDSEKAQISEAESEVRTATNKAQEAKVEAEKALLKLESDKAEYAAVLLEVEKYQSLINQVTDEETTAWSADLADGDGANGGTAEHAWDGSNSVGTIELNNDGNSLPILRPAYFSASAPYNKDRDGVLKPAYYFPFGGKAPTPTAAAAYWNQAMRPGFQKWRPNYKSGRIVSINRPADTCTVRLDPLDIDGVSLNQEETIQNVPIEYMYCNNQAFSTGDHVVVEFGNSLFGNPKVIGYVDNPKPCGAVRLNLSKSTSQSEDVVGSGSGGSRKSCYWVPRCDIPNDPPRNSGGSVNDSYTVTFSKEIKEHSMTYGGKEYKYHYEGQITRSGFQQTVFSDDRPASGDCFDDGTALHTGCYGHGNATADVYFVMGAARIPVLVGSASTVKKPTTRVVAPFNDMEFTRTITVTQAEIEWICSDGRYYSYIERVSTLSYVFDMLGWYLDGDPRPTRTQTVKRITLDDSGYSETPLANNDEANVSNHPHVTGVGASNAEYLSVEIGYGGGQEFNPDFLPFSLWVSSDDWLSHTVYLNTANPLAPHNISMASKYSISSIETCPP